MQTAQTVKFSREKKLVKKQSYGNLAYHLFLELFAEKHTIQLMANICDGSTLGV